MLSFALKELSVLLFYWLYTLNFLSEERKPSNLEAKIIQLFQNDLLILLFGYGN
jgi:hypothetical protein